MTKPKVVHITTFQRAGSGIAAMRLHKALLKQDYDSKFLFLDKGIESETEKVYQKKFYPFHLLLRILKKLGLPLTLEQRNDYSIRKYKYQVELFSFANTPYKKLHEHYLIREADIIHLHFISDFVDFKTFFNHIDKPIVWTLHDMNPFQGGFHYKGDEIKFGTALQNLDKEQFGCKRTALHGLPSEILTITTPSEWLLHLSESSEMLNRFLNVYIPNCINSNIFKNTNSRNSYKEKNKKLNVLFVSESIHNSRKGFSYIQKLLSDTAVTDTCNFSAVGYVRKSSRLPNVKYIGSVVAEEEMSRLYNEADIFLLPSREDNLPNAMIESLCCGLPVVGFTIGGVRETIRDGENGFLSAEISSEGLKKALFACIENLHRLDNTTIETWAHSRYSEKVVADQFINLYEKCLRRETETHKIQIMANQKT